MTPPNPTILQTSLQKEEKELWWLLSYIKCKENYLHQRQTLKVLGQENVNDWVEEKIPMSKRNKPKKSSFFVVR